MIKFRNVVATRRQEDEEISWQKDSKLFCVFYFLCWIVFTQCILLKYIYYKEFICDEILKFFI